MAKINKSQIKARKKNKIGAPPGTPIYVGLDRTAKMSITLYSYNNQEYNITNVTNIEKIQKLDPNFQHWINVIGVHNADEIVKLCHILSIHVLTIEDILNTQSRPKCEINDDYIFSSLKMLKNEDPLIIVEDEHISIVLFNNVVVSFQEVEGDVFNPIRDRIANPKSRLRSRGCDYLFSLLHDVIVDSFIEIVDIVEERNNELENEIMLGVTGNQLINIQNLKKDILYIKKSLAPMRESFAKLIRTNSPLFKSDTLRFIADIHDHLEYSIEGIDAQLQITIGVRELYMSSMDISMNNVMKVLTVVTTIFIPLTFIVGIYGMNFDNMPELKTKYGYFITLGVMLFIAIIMLIYFKRKRWI